MTKHLTARARTRALAVLGMLTLASGSAVAQQVSTPGWLPPAPVTSVPPGSVLRWPTMVMKGETSYVVANALVPRDGRGALVSTFFRIPGEPLPLPEGRRAVLYPSLSVAPDGALNMIWGEPLDTATADPSNDYRVGSLWFARFDGRQWSTPELIINGSPAQLFVRDAPGTTTTDARGRVHLVAPSPSAASLHFVRDSAGWRSDTLPRGDAASITSWGEGNLAIAYVDTRREAPGRTFLELRVIISRDDGRSWGSPQSVLRVPGTFIRSSMLLFGAGRLHALWVVGDLRTAGAELLHASRSAADEGDGRTSEWRTSSLAFRHSHYLRFTAAMNGCGTLLALGESMVRTATENALVLDEFVWPGEAADQAAVRRDFVPAAGDVMGAGVAATKDGFRTVFSVVPEGAELGSTYTSSRNACSVRSSR